MTGAPGGAPTPPTPPTPLPVDRAVRYVLRMGSDWHTGTGTGIPGGIDRLVARDEAGLPYMPAKTLTGVWRDSCEVAARALDGGPVGPWRRWVEAIFGSQPGLGDDPGSRAGLPPRGALLRVRRARYPQGVRDAVAERSALAAAATFVKPGVRMNPATGRADPGMLRFEECARTGAVLVGTVELVDLAGLDVGEAQLNERQRRCATALLLAGSRLLEQLGGKRRRGNGRCALELPTLGDPEPWWRWLEELAAPVEPPGLDPGPSGRSAGPGPADRTRPAARGGWEVARLRLRLDSPLLAGGRTLGNEVLGRGCLPGTTLVPETLRRLGDGAVTALRQGDLLVTDATVEIDGQAGLPAPRTLAAHKSDPSWIVNRANVEPGGEDGQAQREPVQLKPVKDGYVAADEPFRYRRPLRSVHTHNSVEDARQRPTEAAGGGLFTYRALPAGVMLRAEVRVRAGVLPAGWERKLAGPWALGRSRKDDYGAATVEAEPGTATRPRPAVGAGRRIAVWLVSDLILLDERLRPATDPTALRAALGAALGVTLGDVDGSGDAGDPRAAAGDRPVRSALATRRTDSWQRRWGLPRPTLLGFAAGTLATYDVTAGRLDPARVALVETEGVGERRGEGFGQVRVASWPEDGQGAPDGPFVVTTFRDGRRPERADARPPAAGTTADRRPPTTPRSSARWSARRGGPRSPGGPRTWPAATATGSSAPAWRRSDPPSSACSATRPACSTATPRRWPRCWKP